MDLTKAKHDDIVGEVKNRVMESLSIIDELVEANRLPEDCLQLKQQMAESLADAINRRVVNP